MTSAKPQSRARLIRPFSEQPLAGKLLVAIAAPVLLGALAGWLLGVNAPAYWILQVLAAIGAFTAGLEHRNAREGAIRGVIGGALFGTAIVLTRTITDRPDLIALGTSPAVFAISFAIGGSILGALGGWRSRIG
jgi:hypothetical protein